MESTQKRSLRHTAASIAMTGAILLCCCDPLPASAEPHMSDELRRALGSRDLADLLTLSVQFSKQRIVELTKVYRECVRLVEYCLVVSYEERKIDDTTYEFAELPIYRDDWLSPGGGNFESNDHDFRRGRWFTSGELYLSQRDAIPLQDGHLFIKLSQLATYADALGKL
ncbi:MAG: hypothetical protein HY749_08590 [Gammaproteobacteria bacterium]|nr:hypothetical protein [Gammaproteobacteria bacterium]